MLSSFLINREEEDAIVISNFPSEVAVPIFEFGDHFVFHVSLFILVPSSFSEYRFYHCFAVCSREV